MFTLIEALSQPSRLSFPGYPLRSAARSLGAAVLLVLVLPLSATAQIVVDQFQLNGAEQNQTIFLGRTVGQTFTAGETGRLDSLEISFSNNTIATLVVEVLDLSGGDPAVAPVLGTVVESCCSIGPDTLVVESVTGTEFDLSGLEIDIQAGDPLGVRLSSDGACCGVSLRTSLSNEYAAGSMTVNDSLVPASDIAFKTTVDLPEPHATMALGSGCCLLAGLSRCRRRRV